MLRDQNPHIICPFTTSRNRVVLTAHSSRSRIIDNAFSLITHTDLVAQPRDKLRTSYVVFFLGIQTSDFETSLFAVLLCDDDPAVIVLFVFVEQLFE